MRGDTDTFALNKLAWENAAYSDVWCIFTHLGPHIYLNVKYLFFKVLLLHNASASGPLINPAVLTLALHYIKGPHINYRANITQLYCLGKRRL